MTDQALRRGGIALFAALVAVLVATLVLTPGVVGHPRVTDERMTLQAIDLVVPVAVAVTTLLLVWLRPRNSVGWLLGLAGLAGGLCGAGQAYGARALVVDPDLPLGPEVLALTAGLWLPAVLLPATLLLARYPSGHLSGRWARRVDRGLVAAFLVLPIAYASSPEAVTDVVGDAGAEAPRLLPEPVALPLVVGCLAVLLAGTVLVTGMTVRRLLRAPWPERPQLALLLTATTVLIAVAFVSPWDWLISVAFALLPAAVAVGVLRYRLLGIELVVRRTLLYGTLSAGVLLVFVAVTSTLTGVLPDGRGPEVMAATLVAVLVVPARDRLQGLVDRLVYGERDDPWRALSRLGREATGGTGLSDVVAAVAASLRLPGAEVRGTDGTTAVWGEVGSDVRVVPLVLGDEQVGELRVAPRRGERALSAADGRLLEALAPLVALVLRSAVLTDALGVERERVVQATEAERGRLRRDLHDGLGPSLTGIGLGLEAVDRGELPACSRAVVARLRAEVSASLEEVRRILDDLRPGALVTGDLLQVLRARAAHLTSTTPLRVEVVGPDALPGLPVRVEAAALRIVEEALTNVVRHAGATRCTVVVALDDELRIEVSDDGVGCAGPRAGGVGLASMRARAEGLGGRVDVVADGGTRVVVALPVGVPA